MPGVLICVKCCLNMKGFILILSGKVWIGFGFLFIQIFLFNMLRIYVVNHPNGIQYSMYGEGISKISKKDIFLL